MKIDFVSDVACPWCAVGLASPVCSSYITGVVFPITGTVGT